MVYPGTSARVTAGRNYLLDTNPDAVRARRVINALEWLETERIFEAGTRLVQVADDKIDVMDG